VNGGRSVGLSTIYLYLKSSWTSAKVAIPSRRKSDLRQFRNLPLLEETVEAVSLAKSLVREVSLPEQASADGLHIAIAAVHGMDYLLTWNCTHIANASLRSRIDAACRKHGYEPPIICTPDELLQREETEDG
jgi:hypothetical protein